MEPVQIDGLPAGRTDELERGYLAGPLDVVDLVMALVQHAGPVQPPHDVHAAIDAGQSHVMADGQGHGPARPVYLVGQLDPRGGGADDEHSAILQLVRFAVLRRGDRGDARG